jgi:tRNA nucleotidyltransferase (CCA-adding enzyme)
MVGATTTLLVEQLREAGVQLSSIDATLLTLGIYEDNGSLLYGTTTPRDIAAAAWLVDKGGPGRGAAFSPAPAQRRTARAVRAAPQGYPGARCARSSDRHRGGPGAAQHRPGVDVAHKIRELLEPNALFMLVQMGSRLQMVARSTVDEIDVGGWPSSLARRAWTRAAAMIEDAVLDAVRSRLSDLLDIWSLHR